jgi:hypothetical protein
MSSNNSSHHVVLPLAVQPDAARAAMCLRNMLQKQTCASLCTQEPQPAAATAGDNQAQAGSRTLVCAVADSHHCPYPLSCLGCTTRLQRYGSMDRNSVCLMGKLNMGNVYFTAASCSSWLQHHTTAAAPSSDKVSLGAAEVGWLAAHEAGVMCCYTTSFNQQPAASNSWHHKSPIPMHRMRLELQQYLPCTELPRHKARPARAWWCATRAARQSRLRQAACRTTALENMQAADFMLSPANSTMLRINTYSAPAHTWRPRSNL